MGKKIVFVINKSDLVPEDNIKAWAAKFKAQKHLCVVSQANNTIIGIKE
jgi:ribosome biogenesis GTPase A